MPTSIPYDPALALGNLVDPVILDNLLKIAELQAPIDVAQDLLNSFITLKRSIKMTKQELVDMNINVADLVTKEAEIDKALTKAATDYASISIAQQEQIQPLKAKMTGVKSSYESPIDYLRSELKQIPLSFDSIKMDAQYFSFDMDEQHANNSMKNLKSYVSGALDILGVDTSTNVAKASMKQVSDQRELHSIAGTLVITAVCTHKQAEVFAPFILDVDKAVRVWNKVFQANDKKIKMNDIGDVEAIAQEEGTTGESSLNIISGATYGSSFVGMVHILRQDESKSSQTMESTAKTLQAQMEAGAWFKKEGGGFGVDQEMSSDVKNLLSQQVVNSHISLLTVGSIPSIKSNQVKLGVKTFADFDPAKMMTNLATLQNATSSDIDSVADAAQQARTGNQLVAMKDAQVKNVLLSLSQIDDGSNKVMDINSLMTAFEDYVVKALAGNIGVPINYYIKPLTRAQIAQMWLAKYFPGKYLSISGDDSARTGTSAPNASSGSQAGNNASDGSASGSSDSGSDGSSDTSGDSSSSDSSSGDTSGQ